MLSLSVPGTRRGLAKSVASGVVCSMLAGRAAASNQLEKVDKIKDMSHESAWPAREARRQVDEFTTKAWIPTINVGVLVSRHDQQSRAVQTKPHAIEDRLHTSQLEIVKWVSWTENNVATE